MKLSTSIVIIIFLYSINSLGQQTKIDSLKVELKNVNDDFLKIKILTVLCDELATNYNSENDEEYIKQLIILSKTHKNYKSLIKGYQNYSTYFLWKSDLETSIEYILKAEKICSSIGDYKSQLDCITQAGAVYSDLNQFENAQKILLKGESIINKNEITKESCTVYTSYAYFFMKKEDEQNAIDYYIKALNCLNDFNDFQTKLNCYNGLCWLYIDRKQYDKAENYALSAIIDSKKIRSEFNESIFNRILGRVYIDKNKIQQAIEHQLLALNYFIKSNHQLGYFDMSNQLAFSYWKNKEYQISKDYALKANEIAIKIKDTLCLNSSNISIAKAYLGLNEIIRAEKILKEVAKDTINKTHWPSHIKEDLLIELYLLNIKKGDFKEALKYNRSLLKLRDSLSAARFNNQVISAETKYQAEKKEAENNQLKIDKANQEIVLTKERTRKWLLGSGMGVSLITLVVFGYYYQRNKKQKELIENLQKELHHRVKNNLSIIDTFIEVAKEEFTDIQFQSKLTELQNRIASINQIHKQLYVNKNITSLNLNNYISSLSKNIQHSFLNDGILINQNIHKNIEIEVSKSFPIGLIVNEFITNSYKYAFNNSSNGIIDVSINDEGKNYTISLKDNGKGLPTDFNLNETNTFGIRIMKLLTDQLNGTFQLSNNNGVQLIIEIAK